MAGEKQLLLFESMEVAVIESLYREEVEDEEVCPDCDCILEVSYDKQGIARNYCDNCKSSVQRSTTMTTADMDIVTGAEPERSGINGLGDF